jgi:hypothetical protein
MDIKSLIKVADDKELARARDAVALITQRGFHRITRPESDGAEATEAREVKPIVPKIL